MVAPARSHAAAGLVEYFMLDGAIAQATRLDAPTRARVLSQLTLARQRTAAAETLWSNNHTAEALRLSIVSLDDTLAAAAILADLAPAKEPIEVAASDVSPAAAGQEGGAASTATPESAPPASAAPPEEPWRRALRTRNVRPAKIARVTETVLASRTTALPTLDADMSQTLAELFVRATVARQAVDDAIAPVCGSLAELRWARVRRGATLLLTAIAIVVGLYLTLHVPQGTFVTASDVWAQAPSFAAEMAVDGNRETAWLLADRTTGWLEVRTAPTRRVQRIVLTNASNAPSLDRGTSDYRLEIYVHGTLARSIDGHFDWSDRPEPVTHEVGLDGVDRVRFVVRGFLRTGAGLAEMSIQ